PRIVCPERPPIQRHEDTALARIEASERHTAFGRMKPRGDAITSQVPPGIDGREMHRVAMGRVERETARRARTRVELVLVNHKVTTCGHGGVGWDLILLQGAL